MIERFLWAGTAAILVSAGLTFGLVRLGARWPLQAKRAGRGFGGPAVALGVLAGIAPALPGVGTWLALGGAAIVLVGLLDDLLDLSPWQKLLGQMVGASLAAVGLAQASPVLFGVSVPLGAGRVVVTFLWVLTVTNAVNLIDGLDGLAVGVLLAPVACLLAVAVRQGMATEGVVGVSALAALVGFAPANVGRARLLLGDTGAEFLGYLLAVLSLAVLRRGETGWAIFPAVLLAAIPLGDTLFAVVRRVVAKKPVFERDEGHIHHRLAARLGTRGAVAALTGMSLVASGLAFLLWSAGA